MFAVNKSVLIAVLLHSCFATIYARVIQEETSSDACPPPQLAFNGTETEQGEVRIRKDYTHIREVKFSGSIGPLGEKRLCKIKCIGGQWVGPLCVDNHDNGRFHPLFRSCKLEYINPHLVVTFRNVSIQTAGWVFPHEAKLQIRCRELGLYKLLGTASPRCQNGVWSARLPSCVPTTLLTNFTGWAIAAEERDWKYRLSIYYVKPQDSGTFTCATPRGITNSLTLQVAAVHCDPISVSGPHLTIRVEGTRLGHTAIFQCPMGFKVNGAANLTCQASGKWSAPVPTCELVKCESLDTPGGLYEPHLHLEEHNNSYGGRAIFSCAWGYRLMGPPGIECELNGNWSGPLPKCVPIQCPPPVIPVNGHLIQSEAAGMDGGRYAVGSLVQFACRGAHQLEGEASIICTETGFWSHPPPFCKPRCPYLGEPDNGLVAPTKFAYEPGDELQITCSPGFEARLEARPKCLPDGRWSAPLPNCTNYSEI
nr:PREDICTED: locomotion-related protein Hikaru genki isoform X2 [Tribolium castaneum]|eukprot:XP_015833029.1 PREDICTED: locomotion-related protein Hikaru genki isoform X2 [Tribolium castaneum]